jgi:hypothetical protein
MQGVRATCANPPTEPKPNCVPQVAASQLKYTSGHASEFLPFRVYERLLPLLGGTRVVPPRVQYQQVCSDFLFGCILPVAEFRLHFDLEHSSTHSVDFFSLKTPPDRARQELSNYLFLTVNGQREVNGQRGHPAVKK